MSDFKKMIKQVIKIGNSEYILLPNKIKKDLDIDEYITIYSDGKKMIIEKLEIGAD